MVEQLFDISAKDFEMKLRRDEPMPRDTSALQEDLAFLDDQRTNRNMIISSKIDTELEARFQRKIDRCKRKEEYKDRVQKSNDSIIRDNKEKIGGKRQWNHNFFPNNDINFNFASEEPTEPKKTRAESQLDAGSVIAKSEDFVPNKNVNFHEASSKSRHQFRPSYFRVEKEITSEGLIAATTSTSVRAGLSIRDQTLLIASVVNYLGGDVKQLKLNRESVRRRRYRFLEEEGGQIHNEYINLMANKMLVLHFDGKILKHIGEETRQATTADRLSVSVTSPVTKDDLLLGVVPTDSGKGIDMAISIMNLLEYFENCNYIVGFCSDTTVSNTGWKSGAITIMARFLGKPFLWLLCRHHIAEINITWALKAISMKMSKAPANKLLKDFQQKWITEFFPKVSASGAVEKFKRFPEQDLIVGSDLCKLYLKSKKFVTKALEHEIFPRNDYRHLVEYLAYYMNVKSEKLNNFHIYQPGACHNARFMAYAIYFLMLDMTSTVVEYLTP
nr:uncharacterized protein LOC105844719 [Hydra vulgaris]